MPEYHLVYETENIKTGKTYIGVHSAQSKEDEYLGSGDFLLREIKKYGRKNFQRRIICECMSREHALKIESFLVNDKYVARQDTYNLQLGGSCPIWLSKKWAAEIKELIDNSVTSPSTLD